MPVREHSQGRKGGGRLSLCPRCFPKHSAVLKSPHGVLLRPPILLHPSPSSHDWKQIVLGYNTPGCALTCTVQWHCATWIFTYSCIKQFSCKFLGKSACSWSMTRTHTKTIKFDRRLEVALVPSYAFLCAFDNVSEMGNWECLSTPEKQDSHLGTVPPQGWDALRSERASPGKRENLVWKSTLKRAGGAG